MKSFLLSVCLFLCSSISFSQFNGVTGVGRGVIISNYGVISSFYTSLYPLADTVHNIIVQEDVAGVNFTTGINTSSPILFWDYNRGVIPAPGDTLWHAVAGTVTTGSVDGGVNDRLEFSIPVGTNPGQVPPGSDIMYYIQVNDDVNSVTGYAFASTSSFPSVLPALVPADMWKIRANDSVTYNTKRMDGLFFDWQPNERIDTLPNATNGEVSEVRASWGDIYTYFYIDKLTNWSASEALYIYMNTDNDTTNNGREGVTLGGLTPTLPFRYDFVGMIRPAIGIPSTDIRTYLNRNVYGGDTIYYSFDADTDILEIAIPRAAIGATSTSTVMSTFIYIADTISGNIITTWPSTDQDISGADDGGIDFNLVVPRWFSYTLAPGQVPGITESILPVELISFSGTALNNKVQLSWSTATEIDNFGFDIERSTDKIKWDKIGFVQGSGISNSTKNYSFTDDNAISGSKLLYRLKQIDKNGEYEFSPVIEVQLNMLQDFILDQNYPNPFNPVTIIKFGFTNNTKAELKIYDVLGTEVAVLFNGNAEAGRIYDIRFNASDLASGIYYYKLTGNNKTEIKKMILLK